MAERIVCCLSSGNFLWNVIALTTNVHFELALASRDAIEKLHNLLRASLILCACVKDSKGRPIQIQNQFISVPSPVACGVEYLACQFGFLKNSCAVL